MSDFTASAARPSTISVGGSVVMAATSVRKITPTVSDPKPAVIGNGERERLPGRTGLQFLGVALVELEE